MKSNIVVFVALLILPLGLGAKTKLTSLEESPAYFSAAVADRIIAARLETMTIDYDCLQIEPCKVQLQRIKRSLPGIKVRIYVNPMELFATQDSLDQRPMQKRIAEKVQAEFPQFYLRDVNGQNITWWQTPLMFMMNLSNMCPRYRGKVWSEFLIDTIYRQVYLPNVGLIDGIEFDNVNPYISWVNEVRGVQIDLDNEGRPEDFFILDTAWRAGIINMLVYARSVFPRGFIITSRCYHDQIAPYVDGMTLENFPYLSEDSVQGGAFARLERWIRLSQLGKYYTLNANLGSSEQNESAYAWVLLGNGYFSLDHSPAPHGITTSLDLMDLGKPLEKTVFPYQVAFDSHHSLQGLQGQYSLENNIIRLDPGQKIWLHLPAGKWKVNFAYEDMEGRYCSSELRFTYTGMPAEVRAKLNFHRWFDGEQYDDMDGPGEFVWEYKGAGHAVIKYIIIRDMTKGNLYFSRRYEHGTAVINPGSKPIELSLSDGSIFILAPGQGKVLFQ